MEERPEGGHSQLMDDIDDLVRGLAMKIELQRWEMEQAEFQNPQTSLSEGQQDRRMNDMLHTPVSEFKLQIKGNKKTTDQFIAEHFDFSEVATTGDSIINLEQIRNKLMSYQIFTDIQIEVDRGDYMHELDITVDVTEKDSVMGGSLGVETNSRDVLGKAGWGLKNIGGRAESLTFEVSGGGANENSLSRSSLFATTHKYNATFSKPRFFSTDFTMLAQVFSKKENHTRNSSYNENVEGVRCAFVDDSYKHRFGYQCEFRMVEPTARNDTSRPSPSILYEGREPSLKSSIFYSYVNNQRQNMPIPTSGFYRMFNFEVAGLGGNVEFLKMESMLSWHWPILFGVFNIGIQSGFISPLRKIVGCANDGIANRYFQDTQTRINDRLQIGGRLLARGYEYGKIGDKDEGDYLNGDALLAAGASFSFPIGTTGLAGHLFATAGNVKYRNEKNTLKEDLTSLVVESRTSIGASLVVPMPIGRLEFGMAVPLSQPPKDQFSNLFWGFDINFF